MCSAIVMYCIYHSENEGKINCNQTEMPLQEVFWESSFYQLESGLHDASKAIFSTACRGFPTPLRKRDDHISAKWLLLDSSVLVAYSYVGIQTGNSTLGVLEGSATPLWSKCSLWSNLNWWVHNQILKKEMLHVRLTSCQETYLWDFPGERLWTEMLNFWLTADVSAFKTMRIIGKLWVVAVTRENESFSAPRNI